MLAVPVRSVAGTVRLVLELACDDRTAGGYVIVRCGRPSPTAPPLIYQETEIYDLGAQARPFLLWCHQAQPAPLVLQLFNTAGATVRAAARLDLADPRPRRRAAGAGDRMFDHAADLARGVSVWRNPNYLGRAWMAESIQPVSGAAAARLLLQDPSSDLDLRRTALVAGWTGAVPALTAGRAEISTYENREVVVQTDAPGAGFLVLADRFDPDWVCDDDGTPATIHHTNAFARGVLVPAGRHTVRFRYASNAVALGGGITLAGFALLALCCVWIRRTGGAMRPAEAAPSDGPEAPAP